MTPPPDATARELSLEELWMPFTANRAFKKAPRLLASASGMHYRDPDGRMVLDGTAGPGLLDSYEPDLMSTWTRSAWGADDYDMWQAQFDALANNSALSSQDKQKLDLYASSIRTIEMTATTVGLPKCSLPDARTAEIMGINPANVSRDTEYQKIGGMMMDVMALALACE